MKTYTTAVAILAHNNINYIKLLAKSFSDIYFVVHLDFKAKIDSTLLVDEDIPNLYLLHERVPVFWGGFSQVEATLKLLEGILKVKTIKYIHLISGECYPLISFAEMESYWDQYPGRNFIESHDRPDNAWRVRTWMPHANTKHMRTFSGRVLKRILRLSSCLFNSSGISAYPYYGSLWFSITRSLAEEIVSVNKKTSYFNKYKRITCSDEHAFAMFVREFNSLDVSNDNKRFIQFPPGASNPLYINIDDVIKHNNSLEVKYWFARKFTESSMLKRMKRMPNGL